MKKSIITIISTGMFCWSSISMAGTDTTQAISDEINAQMTTANMEIAQAAGILKDQLIEHLDALPGVYKAYCKIDGTDCSATDQTTNDVEKKDVIIDFFTGGWVIDQGHTSTNLASAADLKEDFRLVESDSQKIVFKKHLCLEVKFKDSSQIDFAKPFYAGKTVVLCALTAEDSTLVDLDDVDDDMTITTTAHVKVAGGTAGWRCFNPHNNFNNGGQALGYDLNPYDGSKTLVVPNVDGILNNCLTQASEDLNTTGGSSGSAGSAGSGSGSADSGSGSADSGSGSADSGSGSAESGSGSAEGGSGGVY